MPVDVSKTNHGRASQTHGDAARLNPFAFPLVTSLANPQATTPEPRGQTPVDAIQQPPAPTPPG